AHFRFLRHPVVLSSRPVDRALDHDRATGDDLALRLSSRNLVARAEDTMRHHCRRADSGRRGQCILAAKCRILLTSRQPHIGPPDALERPILSVLLSRPLPRPFVSGSTWEARWRVLEAAV